MKKIYLAISMICLLAGSSLAGHWEMETHLPQGAIDDMAVTGLSYGGNTMIAVIGGNMGGSAINGVYYYEIGNQNWHDGAWGIPQYPHQAYGLAAVTVNDTIYPNGGYLQDLSAYGDTTYYPIWMSGWYPVPGLELQKPRMNHGLVFIEPDLYAVGGTVFAGAVDSTVEKLNLGAHTVSGATPMPQSRTEAVVTKAVGQDGEEHIYVIGGRTNSGALLNSVIEYDTAGAGGSWIGRTSMPGPGRWMATGAVLNNKIYVMGGTIDLSGNSTRRVDVYDPSTNTWALGDSLPLQLIRAGAWGVNNVIYFFGGYDKGMNAQTDSVWIYHPLAPNAPPLIQPLPNALKNTNYPEFYWGSVPGVGEYRFQISSDSSFSMVDIADGATTDTCKLYPSIYIASEGTYYWRVKSYDWSVPDSSKWSQARRFRLDFTPPDQPIPSTPSDGLFTSNISNVYFSWFPVDSIMSYHLQVFKGDTTTTVYNIFDLGYTYANLDLSMYGEGQYLWRVEAKDSAGNFSAYHSIQSFTIDQTEPYVIYTDPISSASDISPSQAIVIGFSEPMAHAFGSGIFTFTSNPNPGNWNEFWNTTGDTVTLTHDPYGSGVSVGFQINSADDRAGNTLSTGTYSWTFTTTINDVTPPVISVPNANSGSLWAGSGLTFTVGITDDDSVSSATLYWGPAGYSGYTNYSVMNYNMGNANYECNIPGADVLPRGLQYQIVAVDPANNYSYYPASGDYYIHSVHFQAGTTPIGTAVPNDQWHMISIPTDARGTNIYGQLENELGYYDNTKWRLFYWNMSYVEIPGFGSGNISKLGQAYWLRHRLGGTANINFEGPDSSYGNFNQSKPCSLALEPGWNDIGSPFMFSIDWMNVTIPGMVAGPYLYDGAKWLDRDSVIMGSTPIPFVPTRGFSFKNDNGYATYLQISPSSANKSGNTASIKQPDGWQAVVAVENQSGADNNRFGTSSEASEQRDQYDYPEPPSGLTGTSGYFRLAGDRFCTDIRPQLGDGQTWEFAVDCNGETKVTVSLPVEFPAGAECYLADLSRQVSVNVRVNGTYSFTPEPGEKVREFKVIAGQADYAKGVLGSSFALPATTLLLQNRPNPLNSSTAISYQLSTDGPVKLAVYNVAGQLVKTLVNRPQMAGRYTVKWDGRDDQGRSAANGVYFYRLTTGTSTASRQLVIVR